MKNDAIGCAILTLIALALSAGLIFALGYANDRAAQKELARGQAESMILRAQGQARLDSAQAMGTIILAVAALVLSSLPLAVLAVLGILGLAVVALAFVMVRNRPLIIQTPPRLITREIVYLPAPGQSRHDVWRSLTEVGGNRAALPDDQPEKFVEPYIVEL